MKESRKERVFVIFDGSNFYHRLKEPPYQFENLLEFDFGRFVKFVLRNRKLIMARCYVGAVRTEKNNPKSFSLLWAQHRLFSHLTKSRVDIFRGYILKNGGYHEKGVDVKIATDLLVGAYEDLWDTAVILSSDTDLLPAIKKVRSLGKKMEYVGFRCKPSFAMARQTNSFELLTPDEILPFVKKQSFFLLLKSEFCFSFFLFKQKTTWEKGTLFLPSLCFRCGTLFFSLTSEASLASRAPPRR